MPRTPAMMVMVATAMGNLHDFGAIAAFVDEGLVRLVELIEYSVATGNTRDRLARPGQAGKRRRPGKPKHSSKKQPAFHRKPPKLVTGVIPRVEMDPLTPNGLNARIG
jgi:hypothetical protein